MTFSPTLPFAGYSGWTFLKRTMPTQRAAFDASAGQMRNEDYFRKNIGKITSAEELVADRRLLQVALGAYGLESDINNKYFIKKVLADGTLKEGTLANRLSNKQYEKMSAAFGFGDFSTPRNKLSDFADKTMALFKERQFESAVGEQNGDYRIALNAERELPALALKSGSEDTLWYTVLGNIPLRRVFERALGLPSSFGTIDLDQQLSTMKSRLEKRFGTDSVRQFSDPEKVESLIRRFLVQSDITNASAQTSRASAALELLQSGGFRTRSS
jgi:hypothetical protein